MAGTWWKDIDELKAELGDEMEHYSDLFKSAEEIEAES